MFVVGVPMLRSAVQLVKGSPFDMQSCTLYFIAGTLACSGDP